MKLVVLSLMLTPVLFAQELPQSKGDHDLAIYFSPDVEGVTGDMLDLEAGYGYFLFDKLSLRLSLDYAVIEDIAPGEKDYRTTELDAGIHYNLGNGKRLVPYLGVSLGFARLNYLDVMDSSLTYGADCGLLIFITGNVAVDCSLSYRLASNNVFVNDFALEDSDVSFDVGLRVVF